MVGGGLNWWGPIGTGLYGKFGAARVWYNTLYNITNVNLSTTLEVENHDIILYTNLQEYFQDIFSQNK